LAVAQKCGADGRALVRGIAMGYKIQVDLVRAICLHKHNIDHVAHLGPSAAACIGTLLGLPTDFVYQSVQQALHVTTATRQSRKGEISSWKAYAPSHAGKLAVEAVDRAMRGEGAPSPIYEGEDGVIAWMLDRLKAQYSVPLPAPGEAKRAILETYTKEHWAEYQSQALIDLAFRMGRQIESWENVESIVIRTSHHTHYVIGTGSNDPQKFDPIASREPSIIPSCISSPWRSRTAPGIMRGPMRPNVRAGRIPWRCGERSRRSRIRTGPDAIMLRMRA